MRQLLTLGELQLSFGNTAPYSRIASRIFMSSSGKEYDLGSSAVSQAPSMLSSSDIASLWTAQKIHLYSMIKLHTHPRILWERKRRLHEDTPQSHPQEA